MSNTPHPPRIRGLSEIADGYRYILCDAWGVIHNGVTAYRPAVEALRRCRDSGRTVIVLTNAPRPKSEVLKQFARFGVDHDAFDDIVTSGEGARAYLAARPGIPILHVGPERDLPIYDGLDVRLVGPDEATLVSCTGIVRDEEETPEDYLPAMAEWRERGLPFLCANPDRVVERGHRMIWCAGALADRYAAMGGETIVFGKPHAPIYETALARFAALTGGPADRAAVLAIGDAVETDLKGAAGFGLDVLFVTAGIHADAYGPREDPDPDRVDAFLKEAGIGVRAFIPHLAW